MRVRSVDHYTTRPDWQFVPSVLWWQRDPFVLHYDLVMHPAYR